MHLDTSDRRINEILHSPDAPEVLNVLASALETERLRRQNFYADVDKDMKAEFINGEVVIHSPVKKRHTTATGWLYKLLDTFAHIFTLGFVGYEKVMIALTRNDYEPDVVFFGNEKAQHFEDGTWKYPAPDFVVEVLSESTEANDRDLKFLDYQAHGIQEYWIVDAEKETVEQHVLDANGKYELIFKAHRGIIESQAVPGFAIRIEAIFDAQANFEELQRIMALGESSAK